MIKAKKSLGQNFLADEMVVARIIESASPGPEDAIIEIGPGTGALTCKLVEHSGCVLAVEIDPQLVETLRREIVAGNFQLIEADALSVDWDQMVDAAIRFWQECCRLDKQPRVRIIANLPYYISTTIIRTLITQRRCLFDMTLMLQEEVAERIASRAGGREYGYLSVLAQYYCRVEKLFRVPPSSFKPMPKVWSAVTRLTVRDRPAVDVCDEVLFFKLVRAAFAQRRKTVLNNLRVADLDFKRPVEVALKEAKLDVRRRAETLSLEEFARLFRALFV
jgi:16S rRNA (adenine1518-N6/adenine1519-N6)-dimethyltransferase